MNLIAWFVFRICQIFVGSTFALEIEIEDFVVICKFIRYIWCYVKQMHATITPIQLHSMSPVDTQRNDPLSCNRRNPRKKTTIYIYRIKCPAYISNNVTTTQKKSVSQIWFIENLSLAIFGSYQFSRYFPVQIMTSTITNLIIPRRMRGHTLMCIKLSKNRFLPVFRLFRLE